MLCMKVQAGGVSCIATRMNLTPVIVSSVHLYFAGFLTRNNDQFILLRPDSQQSDLFLVIQSVDHGAGRLHKSEDETSYVLCALHATLLSAICVTVCVVD